MPYTAKQVGILQDERTNDPLARSYSGMSDVQFLTSIATEDRINARTTMSAGEIFEQIDLAEFVALSNAETVRVDRVLQQYPKSQRLYIARTISVILPLPNVMPVVQFEHQPFFKTEEVNDILP